MTGSRPTYWPVDRVVIAYNLALAAFWILAWSRAPYAASIAAGHLVIAAIPFLLAWQDRHRSSWLTTTRELYPVALIAVYWIEVGLIRNTFYTAAHDQIIMNLEAAVAGNTLYQFCFPSILSVWLNEVMQAVYLTYYPIVFLTPIVLVARRQHEAVQDVVFNVLVTYLVCYISFALFPVDGPRFASHSSGGTHMTGLFFGLAESLHAGGDQIGAAFPSTHVAACTIMAFMAGRWFSRPAILVYWVGAVGVMISSVFLQNHYIADSVAGLFVGAVTYFAISPMLLWIFHVSEPGSAHSSLRPESRRGRRQSSPH